MWPRENFLFVTELFELCCAIDSVSGVIKWCLTEWSRKRRLVMHFYFKFCVQTKFHSQTDKEIWIELNQKSNNGKWSFFFFPQLLPFHSQCRHFSEGNSKPTVHLISAHWLILLSSAVTVCLEWAVKAAWSRRNTPHIYFQSLIEYCR